MIDPTETQPLPWSEREARRRPWEEPTVEMPGKQPEGRDSPPDRLADRGYRLRARIGNGRLGPIYEGQDDLSQSSGSKHFVAIQLIDDRIVSRPGFAADFERGARELQSLSHPNIVKLLEHGQDRNRHYLVWELLESASLRFVLNDVTELPLEETAAVLRAVGDALLYLHAKSIVHGNLTPSNVLVTFGYEVKLLDIVPTGWLDNPADDLGVPARKPDKRNDVFGLGCLAYEMLSGRHPYNGNTAQEAYRAGLEPAPIAKLGGRQWRALAGALAVHRDDRTPNVSQFLEEFGVTNVERLRTVISATTAEPEPPALDTSPRLPPVEPEPEPSVVAARAVAYEPRRGGMLGKFVLLVLVIAAGALVYLYQDPLRENLAGLLGQESATSPPSGTTTKTDAVPDAGAPAEPLPRSAAVTDPEPATVLAPGASMPEPQRPRADVPAAAPPAAVAPPPAETAIPLPKTDAAPAREPPATAPTVAAVETPAAQQGPTRFSFPQATAAVRENDVAARIVIRRSGNLAGAATVAWWTTDDSAKADTDYADLGARVERFEPGEESRTVFVPLTNDAVAEPTKSFNVYLGRGESARDGEPASGMRVEIVDDD